MPRARITRIKLLFYAIVLTGIYLFTISDLLSIRVNSCRKKLSFHALTSENRIECSHEELDCLYRTDYYNVINQLADEDKNACKIPNLNIWDDKIKKLLKPKPVFTGCKKHSPLTFINHLTNELSVDQRVNLTFFEGKISKCEFATVLRNISKKDHFAIGELRKLSNVPIIIEEDC